MKVPSTAIFHLGTYKTGTSSIQNHLFDNRDHLEQHGILYPESGIVRDKVIGHRHRKLIDPVARGKSSSYIIPTLQDEIQKSNAQKLIMSCEAWSHPRAFAMLGGFISELTDLGFENISGILFLRNLTEYKISHYREFTFRQGNKLDYDSYIANSTSQFDYLFICRNMQSLFGDALTVLDYSKVTDSVDTFINTARISDILPSPQLARANVKPVGPLGIEIMRQANIAGLKRKGGLAFIEHFMSRFPEMSETQWTERSGMEKFVFGQTYRRQLAEILDWNPADIDKLLEDSAPQGRSIYEVSDIIAGELAEWKSQDKPRKRAIA